MASWGVLQYFIILLAVEGYHASAYNIKSLGVLSQIFTEDTNNPLIVVVENANELKAFEDEQAEDFHSAAAIEAKQYINDAIVRENYEAVLYNVLRSGGGFEGDEEEQEAHKRLIANALRKRCQDKNECENKCASKKPKEQCKNKCKAVYDYLLECPPPGNEWKKKENNKGCGKKPCKPSKGGSCRPPKGDSCGCGSPKDNSCGCGSPKKDSCECGSNKNDSCKPKRGKTLPPDWYR